MTSRVVLALGVGQLVNWGVLYYAFGVLLVPVERDLGVPRVAVAGAFSLALLMSAVAAPLVGRWSDRGLGPLLIRGGGFLAAGLLATWALVPGLASLYLIWTGLGLCMAATLYEPAFAVIGRALHDVHDRLRALAAVTVLGGLASTAFLPLTAVLTEAWGWRVAVAVLAGVVCLSTALTSLAVVSPVAPARCAARHRGVSEPVNHSLHEDSSQALQDSRGGNTSGLGAVIAVFSMTSLASAAFTTTLVPAFVDRDFQPTTAAMLGGALGVMQLPGRVLVMNGALATSPVSLLMASLLLQAAGLTVLAVARSAPWATAGVGLFAAGAGLTTIVRPHFVQSVFGMSQAGRLNGTVARAQQLARAAAPVLTVGLATLVGYGTVFAMLAALFAVLALTSRTVLSDL
jgi:MFS family permease